MSPLVFISRYFLILYLAFLTPVGVNAQIKPDSTLGRENSTVNLNQLIKGASSDVISGGAVRGQNLFHSFQEFNVNPQQRVYFTNPDGITNILTRTTGNNPSNILGTLGVLGNANLFLINPNGIIFGKDAQLDIRGSFLATTADDIKFSNTVFSAKKPQSIPLLTIDTLIGLGFTGNPGNIEVQGVGYKRLQPENSLAPSTSVGTIPSGLAVQDGHTLALVGGNVTFAGGVVTASSGTIDIGSVSSGQVSIAFNSPESFSLGYAGVQKFQDISLIKNSFLNASGVQGSNVQISGKNVGLYDSSLAFIENQGTNSLGAIKVNADSLTLAGDTQLTRNVPRGYSQYLGGLISQTFTGKGADIVISTKQLRIQDYSFIYLPTFGSGSGGNLSINASDSVKLFGNSVSYIPVSLITTISGSSGRAGNINLTTKNLSIQNGGQLTSTTLSNGRGGDVSINASDSINVDGFNPFSLNPSLISSTSSASGNGGNLFVTTRQLTLENGGLVATNSITSGGVGNLTINASDFIKISGIIPGSSNSTGIVSSAYVVAPNIQRLLGVPLQLSGSSGNVTINTKQLSITNGGQVSVRNEGIQNAGTLEINANSINLNNSGNITATTASGQGGNIFLNSSDLRLRSDSSITASAGNRGNGGNITINAGTLTAFEKSSFTANASEGRGGNIKINTQGFFLSPNSKITATSERGVNGTVQFITSGIDALNSVALIPTVVIIPKPDDICANQKPGAELIKKVGTGGIPLAPDDSQLNNNTAWNEQSTASSVQLRQPQQYVEARGWVLNPDGQTVRFVADPQNPDPPPSSKKPNCQ